MTGNYRYLAANLRTGLIQSELALTAVSAERTLAGDGGFAANLSLVELSVPQREALLNDTSPAKTTVVLVRDGECLGEWIIWKRVRANDDGPVQLTGKEFLSYLDHRLVPSLNFVQVEQFDIAAALFNDAVGGIPGVGGAVVASVAAYTPSGVKRDRQYAQAEAFAGQRLQELGAVIDGFDRYVTVDIDNTRPTPAMVRQLVLYYPEAGRTLPLAVEASAQDEGTGAVVTTGLAEDGELFAGEAWALGGTYKDASQNDVQVIGSASNPALITKEGYPHLQVSGSWTSVSEKPTIRKHAQALLAAHQTSQIPAPITIRFTEDYQGPSDFMLGDHFNLTIEPSINFPTGATIPVRLMAWTLQPPSAGPETLELQVIRDVTD